MKTQIKCKDTTSVQHITVIGTRLSTRNLSTNSNASGAMLVRPIRAFIKWTRNNEANNLTAIEIENWKKLIQTINKAIIKKIE